MTKREKAEYDAHSVCMLQRGFLEDLKAATEKDDDFEMTIGQQRKLLRVALEQQRCLELFLDPRT